MTFEEFLDDHKIDTAPEGHHHKTQGFVQFDCPFCSPGSGSYRMGYNISKRFTNCWSCGPYKLFSVLHALLPNIQNKDLAEAILTFPSERIEYDIPLNRKLVIPMAKTIAWEQLKFLYTHYNITASQAAPWRLASLDHIGKLGIPPFAILCPIHKFGKCMSWTARTIGSQKQRYYSAKPSQELVDHKHLLYGEDFVRRTIIVCEGVFDAIKIGPGAVATFGCVYTPQQVHLLSKWPHRVVCYDGDEDGLAKGRELAETLAPFPGITERVMLESAKDPGAASLKEIRQLRRVYLD